jgi:hypothetical protein
MRCKACFSGLVHRPFPHWPENADKRRHKMPEGQMHNANALTPAQASQYWRDGYLFPLNLMSIKEAARWRHTLEDMEQNYGEAKMQRTLGTYKRINAQCPLLMS